MSALPLLIFGISGEGVTQSNIGDMVGGCLAAIIVIVLAVLLILSRRQLRLLKSMCGFLLPRIKDNTKN